MAHRFSKKVTAAALVAALISSSVVTVDGHEVVVHKAITDAAIDYLIAQRPELAVCGDTEIRLQLKHGVDHEDDKQFSELGNFLFHFVNATAAPGAPRGLFDTVHPESAFNVRIASQCSAEDWAFGGSQCRSDAFLSPSLVARVANRFWFPFSRVPYLASNEFEWSAALGQLLNHPNTPAKAQGVVGIGHVMHLLQDMTSPPHVRNDAHPPIDMPGFEDLDDHSEFEIFNGRRFMGLKARTFVGPHPVFPTPTEPLIEDFPGFFLRTVAQETHGLAYSEKNLASDIENGNGPAKIGETATHLFTTGGIPIARRDPLKPKHLWIDYTVATAQFEILARKAILWTASFLNYVHKTHPICEQDVDVHGGSGKVISSSSVRGESIVCGAFQTPSNCEATFPSGSVITLTASPVFIDFSPGSDPPFVWDSGPFVGWVGACAGQGSTCKLMVGACPPNAANCTMAERANQIETSAVFERDQLFPPSQGKGYPPWNKPPVIISTPGQVEPRVTGNQVELPGNWHISFFSGDSDDFWMSIGSGHAFELEDELSRDLLFGADGEHDVLTSSGVPLSHEVIGTIRFWEDATGFPAPTLLEVGRISPKEYILKLDDNDDHSNIDLMLLLRRLP